MYAGNGDDSFWGGEGDDLIYAGDGNDNLEGNGGDDVLYGGAGNDTLTAGLGNDLLYGGDGDDSLYAGHDSDGYDTFFGGAGNDVILGGGGTSLIYGGDGDDFIRSGGGDDLVYGGDGNDTIYSVSGNDTLYGGLGVDKFIWGYSITDNIRGNDIIADFRAGNQDSGVINDGVEGNNDFVDLSWLFNWETLPAYKAALNNPTLAATIKSPLEALRHDMLDGQVDFNGTDFTGPTLVINFADGGAAGELTYDETNVVMCFEADTLIQTKSGPCRAKDLHQGMEVWTLDSGFQPIRWVGQSHLDSDRLTQHPNLAPIRLQANSLGQGLPARDLVLSPQHRVLWSNAYFGTGEVLVAAKHLLFLPGVEPAADLSEVTYVHVLFDAHQLILAHGLPSESLYLGPMAHKTLSQDAIEEILYIFPDLNFADVPELCRPEARGGAIRRYRKSLSRVKST